MSFNTNGSSLATAKDLKIRVLDPEQDRPSRLVLGCGLGLGSEEQGVEWAWGEHWGLRTEQMLSVF